MPLQQWAGLESRYSGFNARKHCNHDLQFTAHAICNLPQGATSDRSLFYRPKSIEDRNKPNICIKLSKRSGQITKSHVNSIPNLPSENGGVKGTASYPHISSYLLSLSPRPQSQIHRQEIAIQLMTYCVRPRQWVGTRQRATEISCRIMRTETSAKINAYNDRCACLRSSDTC